MESTFKKYSKFYDLLYKDKNYLNEVDYVDKLIKYNGKNTKSVLDIGCGSGIHAELLYDKGYHVFGVDLSEEMLIEARKSAKNNNKQIEYKCQNITELNINKKFNVVTSLFHVISYLNSNKDLINTFKNINDHLFKGGLFVFDFWYGPGVLSDKPVTRIKRVEDKKISCIRLTEPTLYNDLNCVDVNFELFINEKKTNKTEIVKETHRMRYFFDQELELISDLTGFNIKKKYKWLTFDNPDFDTWYAVWVLEKN
jgi:SAM-dependent methyltransferase